MELKLSGRAMQIMTELNKKSYYTEELCKKFSLTYVWVYTQVSELKKKGLVIESEDLNDKRIKILSLTNEGKLFLAKIEARKSAIAKIDSWLDKKFNEIGIDCERLFG